MPLRATALSPIRQELQIQRGLYTVERGEPLALPCDNIHTPEIYLDRSFWVKSRLGVHRRGVRATPYGSAFQRKALDWLRDNVDSRIPYWYYLATLGHDLHVGTFANLYGAHWHAGWADPFSGESRGPIDPTFETLVKTHPDWPVPYGARGFIENLGWLCGAKVTTAFVSEEIDELVSATGTEYADFDFHEVGTSSAAESNAHTALTTTTGIARATGSPTDADPIYRNVGTITADTTETWQEHGIFNNSTGAAMMDRNLTGGQSVASPDQVQYTYELTKNPEA